MSTADAAESMDLTDGERALCEETYATDFESLEDHQQERFLRILDDLPEPMRAGLDGNTLTKEKVSNEMQDVFVELEDNDDIPDEWKDGAAVFAKAVENRLDLP